MANLEERARNASRRPGFWTVLRPILLLLSIGVAVAIGLEAKGIAKAIAPAGTIYLFLLEMTVIPIIITAIATGLVRLVARTGLLRQVVRLAGVFLLAAAFVGLFGMAIGIFGRPGSGVSARNQGYLSEVISSTVGNTGLDVSFSAPSHPHQAATISDMLTRLVPQNIFAALKQGRIFQIALFSLFFGLAIALLREKQQGLLVRVAEGTLRAFTAINTWLIDLLPIGVICLLSEQIATISNDILLPMLRFAELFLFAAVVILIVTAFVVWARSGRRFWHVVRALLEPSTYAFITGDSLVTLPYAMRALTRRLRFRRDTVYFAQPLLAVTGSFGSLLFFVLAGLFVSQFYGSSLTLNSYLMLLFASTMAAAGTSGRLGAAPAALLPLVLIPLGLPVEAGVAIFGALGIIIRPILALIDVNVSMAAVTLCIERPEVARARSIQAAQTVKRRRRISVRASLVVLIGALIVLTASVLIGLLYSGEKRSVYDLAGNMIQAISARAEQRTLNYFLPAQRSVQQMQFLIQQHLVPTQNRRLLLKALDEEVRDNPEFAAAYYADTGGNFWMVKRMPDGSLSYRIITRGPDRVTVHWQHSNPAYEKSFPDSKESLSQGYDPRSRGWYRDAVKSGGLIWTDVYLFASDNMLGISAAIPIRDEKGNLRGVLAVDIGLAELSYFLGTLEVSKTGKAFILNDKRELVALSTPAGKDLNALFSGPIANGATSPANLVLADEASDPIVRHAFEAYLLSAKKKAFFSFTSNGTRYLSMFSSFPDNRYFPWTMAIAIPEELVMGAVNRTNEIVWYASVLIVVIAVGLGVNFSRAISYPLSRLSQEMERIRNFDLLGDERMGSRIAEIDTMNESFLNMKHGLRAFNKYVPSKLVAQLLEIGEEPKLGGQAKQLTMLFSDVKGFTSISEQLTPSELVDELADYFTALSNIIMKNGGTVDKYIGDAIMAFWNAPVDTAKHAELACRSALAMRKVLAVLSKTRGGQGASVFRTTTRIGIHTGEAIVGNMGSAERLNYTVLGDSVNLASRLEGLNKYYGTDVIVSAKTLNETNGTMVGRLLDRVAVKGRAAGIEIFELVAGADEISNKERERADGATEAVRLYLNRRFEESVARINTLFERGYGDDALRIIAERSAEFMKNDPGAGWNGVFIHHEK